jgi:dTDP-glucose 4,6-dehydratase
MNWTGRAVLVTGAGGFIGSHLTERLVDEGAQVRAFVRYNSRGDIGLLNLLPPEKLAAVQVISGDLRDVEAVRGAVKGVDTVFHLGALIAIPYSYVHPREVIEVNVLGTTNVLMAGRDFAVRRIIHTSTSEVYGTAQYTPIDEGHPLQGQSPYSASKIGADKIVESFVRSFELPVATLRPFNTYGPRQSARAVIPTIITQALARDEIRLGSLTPQRDLTFVADTVDGFVRMATHNAAVGQEVNIGADATITIGELVNKILRIVGRDLPIVTDEQRLRPAGSEVLRLWADNRKAAELIGWRPQISLDEGLARTVDWIRQNLGRYRPGVYEV